MSKLAGDALDVVMLLERSTSLSICAAWVPGQLHVVFEAPSPTSADSGVMPSLHQPPRTASKVSGGVTLPSRAVITQILGAGIEDKWKASCLVGLFLGYDDFAFAMEHPTDGASFSAMLPPCLF